MQSDIFDTILWDSQSSTAAIRKPAENAPVKNYTASEITCNINTSKATQTIAIAAGSMITMALGENKTIYHPGPMSIYLGKAPGKVVDWDGTGKRWFKIAEWGPTLNPFGFNNILGKSKFTVKIPKEVPSGEYLVRTEQIAQHIPGYPEFFVSCAQLKITGGGTGSPSKVSIPGHLSRKNDPDLFVDIYWPVPKKYKARKNFYKLAFDGLTAHLLGSGSARVPRIFEVIPPLSCQV
ncbi:putative endo-beta-1,4-glucanase D [Psilocybe cubensis]|uniref:Endo-beta-1,4-glucanase D n=2 Tax=Psilocybe cubensis TaxID=181762 RepID=A0ACB8GHP7_PSICU|nr:putative endo-beta-1,4-glucanase D [Psilocybe cubensis]KAH9475240.1 putative endo-beta-1,4-glucanase D [Psilocybe cubensis]